MEGLLRLIPARGKCNFVARLIDIAQRAGCSMMTVSKALRGTKGISDETRARIKVLAQQMGYVPDSMALGLRTRKTKLLGLILSNVTNPVFARTVAAIEEQTHKLGYDLILAHTLNTPEREEICIRRLLARRVDGLFIFPTYRLAPTAPVYLELALRQAPVVILGQNAPFCAGFPSVQSDDLHGSYQVTRHLLSLGHTKIAFFAGPISSPAAAERLEGYRRGLREAGLDLDDRLIFTAGSTLEEGAGAAAQFLNEKIRATAIQASNDLVAIGAANFFLANKLRIPQDLSLAGYGNILLSEHCRVPITTINEPKPRLGLAAVEMMEQILRGEKAASLRLPVELIPRASTAALK